MPSNVSLMDTRTLPLVNALARSWLPPMQPTASTFRRHPDQLELAMDD